MKKGNYFFMIFFLLLFCIPGCGRNNNEPAGQVTPKYKLYGLCFSPYLDGQNPDLRTKINEQQIKELLQKVKPYTHWIRTYGSDDGLEKTGALAHSLGLKVAAGAWLSNNLTANQTQIDHLIAMGKAGEIDVAIVGSEVLLRRDLSKDQLIGYIKQVKAALPGIPVATADVYQIFLDHADLVSTVDFLLIHIYPYWEGVSLTCATGFIDNVYSRVKAQSQDKEVIVAETGWPGDGNTLGKAVPSPENAAAFFLNFISWAKAKEVNYYYFSFMDEQWKKSHESAGPHWGIFYKNGGDLKPGMNQVFEGKTNPDNWLQAPSPGSTPSVSFTHVPNTGSFDNLAGVVKGVDPYKYRVAVFIYVTGWWNKPTWDAPLTFIHCDGSFVCDVTTGGIDQNATRIRAYAVPGNFIPPKLAGDPVVPASVEQSAVAWIEATG